MLLMSMVVGWVSERLSCTSSVIACMTILKPRSLLACSPICTTWPQYKPTFELNMRTTLNAERYGLDFVLSMIKLRGFGGKSEFWDHNLESFTLMAGIAAVTSRIRLYATVPTLCIPPAIAARMCATIDSISGGRFGLNVITGWQRPEYSQMGLWPGDEYFAHRYDYAAEYVQIMQ